MCVLALAASLAITQPAAAVGTAFTYQGRIAQTGSAVNGVLDLQFQVFDLAAAGSPVGALIALNDVPVSDGLFTVTLDFGALVFTRNRRWLQIGVSPNFPGTAYTLLNPRQELTPTPNALYATNSTTADLLDGLDSTAFSLVGHSHAANTITGIAAPAVVFGVGAGTGLTGDPVNFSFDTAVNALNVTGFYRIGGSAVVRVSAPLDNTYLGLAGNATTTGSANTGVGEGALLAANNVDQNTAVGFRALASTIGDPAPVPNGLFGDFNTAIGKSALELNTNGFANTAVGTGALGANLTGFVNTAVGAGALAVNTASANVAVGASALTRNTSGGDNTALGTNSLANNTTAGRNTAVGQAALNASNARDNTAVGALALQFNNAGTENVAVGASTLLSNTAGSSNTAVGTYALDANQTGNLNTAIGNQALGAATGSFNTALGAGALDAVSIGTSNIAIGVDAGGQIANGSNNIMIGGGTQPSLADSNNIMIGHPGNAGESGTTRIGNTGTHTNTLIAGIWNTPIAGPIQTVVINGNGRMGTSLASSKRYKEDIVDMGSAAEKLLGLRPVLFRYRADVAPAGDPRAVQYGLIAEEVAAINPDWAIYDPKGDIVGVRYDQINAALLGLAQSQQAKIDLLSTQMNALAERLNKLEAKNAP